MIQLTSAKLHEWLLSGVSGRLPAPLHPCVNKNKKRESAPLLSTQMCSCCSRRGWNKNKCPTRTTQLPGWAMDGRRVLRGETPCSRRPAQTLNPLTHIPVCVCGAPPGYRRANQKRRMSQGGRGQAWIKFEVWSVSFSLSVWRSSDWQASSLLCAVYLMESLFEHYLLLLII